MSDSNVRFKCEEDSIFLVGRTVKSNVKEHDYRENEKLKKKWNEFIPSQEETEAYNTSPKFMHLVQCRVKFQTRGCQIAQLWSKYFDFVPIKNSFFPCLLEHVFPDSTPSSLMTSYVSFVDSFISALFLVIRQGRDNLTTVLWISIFIMSLDGEKKDLIFTSLQLKYIFSFSSKYRLQNTSALAIS